MNARISIISIQFISGRPFSVGLEVFFEAVGGVIGRIVEVVKTCRITRSPDYF